MTQRDIQLVTNILQFLSVHPDNDWMGMGVALPTAFRLGANALPSAQEAQGEAADGTDQALPPDMALAMEAEQQAASQAEEIKRLKTELSIAKKEGETFKKRCNELQEQTEAMTDMFAMAYDYMQGGSTAANGPDSAPLQRIFLQINEQYFGPQAKLKEFFPDALYFNRSAQNGAPRVFMHVVEKAGVAHLVLFTNPLQGPMAAPFPLLAGFMLQHTVATRRYVNASQLIEALQGFTGKLLAESQQGQAPNSWEHEISVLIIDPQNREVEFASTGGQLFTVSGNMLNEHRGGPSKVFGADQPTSPDAHQVSRLHLRWGSGLIFYLPDWHRADKQVLAAPNAPDLKKLVQEIGLLPPAEQERRLNEMLAAPHVGQLPDDLIFISLKF